MFYDHHFMGMHWIWWIAIVATIILIIFNIIPYKNKFEPTEDALDILKKRFARGEIEQEEFEERRRILIENK
ncbi:MAG TPA: SHOCT domain-containing protein [Balneolaceae bacterium]|nr:SHOCT domain-containing protein [Balneolaceae bacterium]